MSNPNPTDVTELISAIDAHIGNVRTQTLDVSFNELLDMHESSELNISPEFQRLFQWSEGARSRFIESLLLEMPLPPIFVVEQKNQTYVLIDGLQRISSYLHLRGRLDAPHLEPPVKKGQFLRLRDCDIISELNGKTYEELGTALQIKLKRAFVNMKVVRKEIDPRFQYHMFKRLNTGGQQLSQQQIRNCTIRLLNPTFNNLIIELSKNVDFVKCTDSLSYERRLSADDQEIVLRFFAFKNDLDSFEHDVSDFLTEYMEKVSDPSKAESGNFDYDAERKAFEKTFAILGTSLGEVSFAYAHPKNLNLSKGFSVYHFEAITIGMQPYLDRLDVGNRPQMQAFADAIKDTKRDPGFIKATTGGGKNSPGPLKARIAFVRDRLANLA